MFSFEMIDNDPSEQEWGWHHLTPDAAQQLLTFMVDISRSRWTEIREMTGSGNRKQHRIHTDVPISELCTKATERLGRYYPEMGGELFHFHVDGLERLWGFPYLGTFFIVWWDPDHKVYPV